MPRPRILAALVPAVPLAMSGTALILFAVSAPANLSALAGLLPLIALSANNAILIRDDASPARAVEGRGCR